MINKEQEKLLGPNLDLCDFDINGMPLIHKCDGIDKLSTLLKVTSVEHYKRVKDPENTILSMFSYDKKLEKYWENYEEYIDEFPTFLAVATPDFSIYPRMERFVVDYHTFQNRSIGAFWQQYFINVIPTVSWAEEWTYDTCFSGIEKGCPVIISTIGVGDNKEMFLKGFEEMKRRIEPELIIVVGNLIKGMKGEIVNFRYEETFNPKVANRQGKLFETDHYVTKKL